MTVAELLERVDGKELDEWAAYEVVAGPLGPSRGDYHAALIATTIANANSKKRFRLSDFMLEWDPNPNQGVVLTPEEMAAKINAAMRALGGKMGDQDDDDAS